MTSQELQCILTHGTEDPERARFALHAALVAASSGLTVTVYLALRAVHWACVVHDDPLHAEIRALVEQVRSAGATVECCSACIDRHCASSHASSSHHPKLDDGVRVAGLATLMKRASSGAQTISF